MIDKDNPNYDWDDDAIKSLVPDAQYARVSGVMNWSKDNSASCPTDDEISKEVEKLKAAYATQAYARQRKEAYPNWAVQLEKIYDDGIANWKSEMVDPVKAKWPKDNSGPK